MAAVAAPKTFAARPQQRRRYAHAFPDGAAVALCGALKRGEGMPTSERCPRCLDAARMSWVAR